MTLTQLEYMVAVDTYRHFVLAAEKCFVTQPTLSMQLQKLEEELGVKLFDRTKQPVIPTEIGTRIIAQARVVLREAERIQQMINSEKNVMTGELRIGIIPTLAPYVLPTLFKQIRTKYPQLELVIKETITEEVLHELKNNRLDCGLVVTPLKDASIKEDVLFYEELFVYVSRKNALYDKKYVLPDDINPDQLWLLEEGHCFRSQVLNLCELRKSADLHFKYATGNIETLKRMVDKSDGLTILPELAVMEFNKNQMKLVKRLKDPAPAREVSLVTHRDHIKTKLIQTLKDEILEMVPKQMRQLRNKKVVEITD
ncbi:MAG: LysR family transcriptional regulator [Sediminibacterium sp. Gen4]|jgi:LysR family transcriptional regulator, hydrogen peroxide-inducible genes activator|uniref:hydrogen peroxide-inducible genes activator n=1 Tax=unclassified Sediminibacterium TaxID=2635961 RepID=UPI0015BD7AF0|nr:MULTISPECIES: hydrogen peroxide-inducible genes activator [unclassified Sediminibacterium]MBW0163017.1 LysR family transcriptional regulator [Sediminibacterium sp.]NWK66764.1 LysR family transcriptional regulator [Sediminibacterium sp. Gen4]